MRTFDQIIFDELAAQRAVLLEGVGYLKVENIPAKLTGKNTISAPRNVVVYTPDLHAEAKNVINILESEGIDYQQARDQYYAWLAEARRDNILRIYSVGVLKDGIFMPTAELDTRLSPYQAAVVVKHKSMAWLWLIIIAAVLLLLFFGYRHWESADKGEASQTENIQTPQPAPAVAVDTTATTSPEIPADDQQVVGKAYNYPVPGRYYVVAGVFDIPENADKLIVKLKRQFPDMTFEKFDYPGARPDRTMVTIYSSTKHNEALNMRRELAWSYDLHEYWIYPPTN